MKSKHFIIHFITFILKGVLILWHLTEQQSQQFEKELSDSILGGRIYKIAQPEPDELLITIKTPEGQRKLYISASASLPLIYLTDANKPSPMTAPNFCMLLRKHIAKRQDRGYLAAQTRTDHSFYNRASG